MKTKNKAYKCKIEIFLMRDSRNNNHYPKEKTATKY